MYKEVIKTLELSNSASIITIATKSVINCDYDRLYKANIYQIVAISYQNDYSREEMRRK